MYHSITFGEINPDNDGFVIGKNTWDDWHLIPTSRPSVVPPEVQTNRVQIPGRNGSIDMTDYLTGSVIFGDRSGSWEFAVDNDHEYWIDIKNKIMAYLHGSKLKCFLEDEPSYFYTGRFSVNEWKSQSYYSSIVIDYVIDPYKMLISSGIPGQPVYKL